MTTRPSSLQLSLKILVQLVFGDVSCFPFFFSVDINEADLGDRKNIQQIAAAFEKQYGVKPSLNRLGSLDELYTHIHQVRSEEPSKFMA